MEGYWEFTCCHSANVRFKNISSYVSKCDIVNRSTLIYILYHRGSNIFLFVRRALEDSTRKKDALKFI